jgi:2Fe-2S ferredoxin
MPFVTLQNLFNAQLNITLCKSSLLQCILDGGYDWMHACGGKGRCTTCKAAVVSGMEAITPPSPAELRYREQGLLMANERLACQIQVLGEVVLRVPKESKLPHITYSDDSSIPPES